MEKLVPQHDWVLLRKIDHEDKTEGGIIIPKAGEDYDNLKSDQARSGYVPDRDIKKNKSRNTNRYTVLAVGPGLYVDVADELHDDVFIRKPMCAQEGATVLVQEGAVPIPVDGEILYMCHDYLILATIVKGEDGRELINPQHDYIFFKQAESMSKSKGGIYTPVAEDHTGTNALPDRYEVLGVGDGPWALRQEKGKIPEFARRPMTVKEGDLFTFEGAGFFVSVAGAYMGVVQNYQVAGIFNAS